MTLALAPLVAVLHVTGAEDLSRTLAADLASNEARFRGDVEWFPGKVDGVNEDGTYAVAYDDGDREENVNPAFVRAAPKPAAKRAKRARKK